MIPKPRPVRPESMLRGAEHWSEEAKRDNEMVVGWLAVSAAELSAELPAVPLLDFLDIDGWTRIRSALTEFRARPEGRERLERIARELTAIEALQAALDEESECAWWHEELVGSMHEDLMRLWTTLRVRRESLSQVEDVSEGRGKPAAVFSRAAVGIVLEVVTRQWLEQVHLDDKAVRRWVSTCIAQLAPGSDVEREINQMWLALKEQVHGGNKREAMRRLEKWIVEWGLRVGYELALKAPGGY